MPEATLLQGFRPHFAEFEGCRVRWFEARRAGSRCCSSMGSAARPRTGRAGARSWLPSAVSSSRISRDTAAPARPPNGARPRLATRTFSPRSSGSRCGPRRSSATRWEVSSRSGSPRAARRSSRALALFESAGSPRLTRRAAVFLGVSAASEAGPQDGCALPARIAGRARLRRLVFGYWGAGRPGVALRGGRPRLARMHTLSTRHDHGRASAAPRRPALRPGGVRCPASSSGARATGSSRSRTASSSRGACGRRSASSRAPATS